MFYISNKNKKPMNKYLRDVCNTYMKKHKILQKITNKDHFYSQEELIS